jgi:SPP1 gp7 family putative phage head morphogenesis protein
MANPPDDPALPLLGPLRDSLRELFSLEFRGAAELIAPKDLPSAEINARGHVERAAAAIARSAAFADLVGRVETLRIAGIDSGMPGIVGTPESFVTMPFGEAIEAFASTTAIHAQDRDEVLRAYSRNEFAMKPQIAFEVVETVQQQIHSMLREGGTKDDFVKWARDLNEGHVSDAYAETVFRTEATRAQTAGRVMQSFSADLAGFVVAFMYNSARTQTTRANHAALHGMMWGANHVAWANILPPNGWNCQCRVIAITRPQARAEERLTDDGEFKSDAWPVPGGHPDKGWENKPALSAYGT